MNKQLKCTLQWILGIAAAAAAVVILLITAFEAAMYLDFSYYQKEYDKYNVLEDLDMEMEDVMYVTEEMMAYLRGDRKNLEVKTVIAGEEGMFFNEREKLHMEDQVAEFVKKAQNVEIQAIKLTFKERNQYAKEQVIETIKKVALYIVVGVGIGAFIHNFIPEHIIESVLGGNKFYSVPLATIVGVPMYADIFGTIPVAESLLIKGAGLGTVLAFMMAVTTLSLPSIIMLSKVVKRKLMIVFISIVSCLE